jgi:G6PDH family F420-dependent oxidoreductase
VTLEIGYKLCSEEHTPDELVRYAERAEEAGFTFAMISDHFHPWTEEQGQSPFVWSVVGAIAHATKRLRVGTGVTCPTFRIHPVIIAQAAATVAAIMPGRFMLGVGSGEYLNEHITGDRWPPADIRLEMLSEAIDVIRLLWRGGEQSHYGKYFTVENACIYTLPKELPPILVAGSGPKSAELAGRVADGFISTAPKEKLLQKFKNAGGDGKPTYAELTVCWAKDKKEAKRTAHRHWPNVAIEGELTAELRVPAHFEQTAKMITEEDVAKKVVCGPDPEEHINAIKEYASAGFDGVWVHQIGPDQQGFFDFYEKEVLPQFSARKAGAGR